MSYERINWVSRVGTSVVLMSVILISGCAPTSDTTAETPIPSAVATTNESSPSPTPPATPSPTRTMPDVIGLDPADARELIGDVAGVIQNRVDVTDRGQDGVVVAQEPQAGTDIDSTTQSTIDSGDYVEPTSPPESEVLDAGGAFAVIVLQLLDDEQRMAVINALVDNGIFESIDLLDVDPAKLALDVAATSGYASEEYVADEAWAAARALAFFWSDDYWEGSEVADGAYPGLEMNVNGLQWSCTGDSMRALATSRISRADWAISCNR